MLRLLGAVLLTAGCSGLGYLMRQDLKRRLLQQKGLIHILEMMKSEVSYGKSSLPEICLTVSAKAGAPYGQFLREVYEESMENSGASFADIWERRSAVLKEKLFLNKQETESLKKFAACCGYMDPQMQVKAIESRILELVKQAEETEAEIAGKGKIYMSLGVVGGLLLTIILF